MNAKRSGHCCTFILALLAAALAGSFCFAQSTPALRSYDGLKGKEREQKLSEGAKKEGKVVVYSLPLSIS